jgi:hypothetical protein
MRILNLWLASILFAAPAVCDTVAFTPSTGLTSIQNGPVNLGMIFSVNNDITVDALGYYNSPGIGLTPIEVGLFTSSGTLLASTTVTPSTPVDGYFFASIAPISLTAGDSYVVDEYTDFWSYGGAGPPTTPSSITYVANNQVYLYSGSFAFPVDTLAHAPTAYYGPNFLIASPIATPEPSFYAVLAIGMAGLIFRIRRSA